MHLVAYERPADAAAGDAAPAEVPMIHVASCDVSEQDGTFTLPPVSLAGRPLRMGWDYDLILQLSEEQVGCGCAGNACGSRTGYRRQGSQPDETVGKLQGYGPTFQTLIIELLPTRSHVMTPRSCHGPTLPACLSALLACRTPSGPASCARWCARCTCAAWRTARSCTKTSCAWRRR